MPTIRGLSFWGKRNLPLSSSHKRLITSSCSLNLREYSVNIYTNGDLSMESVHLNLGEQNMGRVVTDLIAKNFGDILTNRKTIRSIEIKNALVDIGFCRR
jgi:hypothetical protein